MNETQIKHLVDRFLNWKLPRDFNPDAGIRYSRPEGPTVQEMPSGTNLFDASQAYQMVRHMIEGLPAGYVGAGMNDKEAIDMMRRCKDEIAQLRVALDRLKPKADAYDSVASILRLLPQPSIGMGEDLVWILDKRIRELTKPAEGKS